MTTSPSTAAPHSLEAERTVLGALLADPDRIVDIAPVLKEQDFYDPVFRRVYAAIRRLYDDRRPIDFLTVNETLKGDEAVAAVGGSAFLATLASEVPTSSHAITYATIVREHALRRRLADAGRTITGLGVDPTIPAPEALERSEQAMLALSRQSTRQAPEHIASIGEASYDYYSALREATDKSAFFGLMTGFGRLDDVLTGLPPGSLTIVAARPSVGKSSFALDVARAAAGGQGKNVTIFSLEMTKREIMDRIIAGHLGVSAWKLKKGQLSDQDFARMGPLFDQLKSHPIYIDDDADTTISNLRSKARRQQMEHGLDLLIIDYLQLIEVTDRAAGENRTQQVSHISRSLKNLARELQAPIIALAQLSRQTEQRNPPIPILSDLRESGGIEQDSDVVLMLYREDVYNEDSEKPGMTDVYIRKNRHGPTGRIELFFDKEKMSFRDLSPPPPHRV